MASKPARRRGGSPTRHRVGQLATRHVGELELHPAAALVPEMSDEEYAGLVADVRARGLVTPLDVTAEGEVLDGRHRLQAARDLDLVEVAVRVVSPPDPVDYLVSVALHRRHLTASQRAAVMVDLDAYRESQSTAVARSRANLDGAASEVATLPPRGERTREAAARVAGVSPRLIQDAACVRKADRAIFDQVKRGEVAVHRAANQIRRAFTAGALPQAPALPSGVFEVIYADPPWASQNPDSDYAPERHYPTLSVAEIEGLEVPAAEDAILFLWAVAARLPEAMSVIEAWGFTYRGQMVWVKPSIGLGTWVRYRHEVLLVATRGAWPVPEPALRPDSVVQAKRGRHSEKPVAVYAAIERAYPDARRVELFARTHRPGWTAWGNEVAA